MEIAVILVNWLHMAAGFTWIGGIIFVNVVLTPVVQAKGIPPEMIRIMGMERFRYYAWGSIVVIVFSGVFNTWRGLAESVEPAPPLFVGAMAAKLAIVAVMIGLTLVSSVAMRRRMINAKPSPGGPSPEIKLMSRRLMIFSRVNLILGLLVLLMVAIMMAAAD